MLNMRRFPDGLFASVALMAFLLAGFAGCQGCGTLAPGGVYSGDKLLYETDVAIGTSYMVLDEFLKWELQNRSALTNTPAIKQAADKIRLEAPKAFKSAIAVRDAYAISPNAENRTAVNRALDTIHSMFVEAVKLRVQTP